MITAVYVGSADQLEIVDPPLILVRNEEVQVGAEHAHLLALRDDVQLTEVGTFPVPSDDDDTKEF